MVRNRDCESGDVVDTVDAATRSAIMSRVRSTDTKPEMAVRRALHARGYRYSLHSRSLPGRPDIVLTRHQAVVMVHGCFWHGHDCRLYRLPQSRQEYWSAKVERNKARDSDVQKKLKDMGWRCFVVWECAVRRPGGREVEEIAGRFEKWLNGHRQFGQVKGRR